MMFTMLTFSFITHSIVHNLIRRYNYGIRTSFSDYRGNLAPSDSDRDCTSRRDSDPASNQQLRAGDAQTHQPTRLSITAPSADSESGDGSPTPSPRALRRRTKIRNHSLTSLCLLSHHPFFSTFRETLFILKKLVDACNESSSPKSVGASRLSTRYAACSYEFSTALLIL